MVWSAVICGVVVRNAEGRAVRVGCVVVAMDGALVAGVKVAD